MSSNNRTLSPVAMRGDALDRLEAVARRIGRDRSKVVRALIECEMGVGDEADAALVGMIRRALAEVAEAEPAVA
jgi:predicted DNA-binding protein